MGAIFKAIAKVPVTKRMFVASQMFGRKFGLIRTLYFCQELTLNIYLLVIHCIHFHLHISLILLTLVLSLSRFGYIVFHIFYLVD